MRNTNLAEITNSLKIKLFQNFINKEHKQECTNECAYHLKVLISFTPCHTLKILYPRIQRDFR